MMSLVPILALSLACVVFTADPLEKDDLFEGDMTLTEEQRAMMEHGLGQDYGAIRELSKRWPEKTLYYSFASNVPAWKATKLRRVLSGLQDKVDSCVQFVESSSHKHRVVVNDHHKYCNSWVGFINKRYDMNLANSCWAPGVIEHEFLHALGIFHQQGRSDRDEYVTINLENVKWGPKGRTHFHHNFKKYDQSYINHYDVPYDYHSVMHYGRNAFSKNWDLETITTKDPAMRNSIGNRDGVTDCDILLIKRMYGCDDGNTVCNGATTTTKTERK